MATTLTALRDGLAANLAVLDGIEVYPRMVANPDPPAIHLFPADITYGATMSRGYDVWIFTVQAFVGLIDADESQLNLDAFLSPAGAQSVKAAIEADPTLGGAAAALNVTTCSGYRPYLREGMPAVLGAEWSVEVWAAGT